MFYEIEFEITDPAETVTWQRGTRGEALAAAAAACDIALTDVTLLTYTTGAEPEAVETFSPDAPPA